jgi:hypothetical protein
MSNLNNNTTQLEALLAKVNELPEAGGGADTSDATATSDEIFAGETAYGAEGKITGTFTIQNELTEQNDLISQIATLVTTKANPQGGTEDLDTELTTQESLISQLNSILDSKASGGGSIETCEFSIVTTAKHEAWSGQLVYIDGNGNAQSTSSGPCAVLKNSLVVAYLGTLSGNATLICDGRINVNTYFVTGDFYATADM